MDDAHTKPRPLPPWVLPAAGLVVFVALVLSGLRFGIAAVILALSGGALLGVVWLGFRAVQAVVEPSIDEALEEAPTPAQMEKLAALRALKEIEYEHRVGNITDEDFRELERKYREEAKRAMRAVDEERRERRQRAEALARKAIEKQLGRDDDRAASEGEREDAEAAEREDARADAEAKPTRQPICRACKTKNDADAKFCKSCGAKLEGEA